MLDGSCHCGNVRIEVPDRPAALTLCNCSICRPKGYLHWFVKDLGFRLLKGDDAMGTYTFHKEVLNHRFCLNCGVSPFVQGPGTTAVNARCLEGVDVHAIKIEQIEHRAVERR